MEVWAKIRRFLVIWVGILGILLVAAVIVYRHDLKSAIVGSITGALGSLFTAALIIGAIIYLFRVVFRR